MKRSKRPLLLLALLMPACHTAGPKLKPATGAQLPELLRPYAGALRVLPGRADEKLLRLKPGETLAGTCDIAVRVASVAFEQGEARFALDGIGQPLVGERRPRCKVFLPALQLVLAGFPEGAVTPEVTARIDSVLLTPEDYLRRKGVTFDRAKGEAPTEVASQLADANESERRLARAVVAWPKPVLAVEALYRDASGRGRHERLVALEATVGSDGRIHRHALKASIDRAHQEVLEAALPLWRFEPARRADGPLGARIPLEASLRVY
jgi:hypothetical protein